MCTIQNEEFYKWLKPVLDLPAPPPRPPPSLSLSLSLSLSHTHTHNIVLFFDGYKNQTVYLRYKVILSHNFNTWPSLTCRLPNIYATTES